MTDEAGERRLAEDVFGPAFGSMAAYADLLTTRGVEWGLLGPREPERIWERHIFNSVALSELVEDGRSVVDVGSGAGLPGIPLAIARPDLRVTLLEPLLRRSQFLEMAVAELGLADRVTVVRGRAEEWPRSAERFDAVTSRAVAPLERLVGWCRGLRASGGWILALKGERADQEIREAARALRSWRLQADSVHVGVDPRVVPATVARVWGVG